MTRPLALIPARKGSKGLPGKNTRLFAGKPLIAHTIEAALASNCVDVFVSTDDMDVLKIAQAYNLPIDYVRPSSLAGDEIGMIDVALDALQWRRDRGHIDNAVCLLQPTSPLRTAKDISDAIGLYANHDQASVFGVSKMWTHPSDCIQIFNTPKADSITSWNYLVETESAARRQDYKDDYYFINGALYITPTTQLQSHKKFVTKQSIPFLMNSINTLDIDTFRDFLLAEALYKSLNAFDEQEHLTR